MTADSLIKDLEDNKEVHSTVLIRELKHLKQSLDSTRELIDLISGEENMDYSDVRSWIMEHKDSERKSGWYLVQDNKIDEKYPASYSQDRKVWQTINEDAPVETSYFYWVGSQEIIHTLTKRNLIK